MASKQALLLTGAAGLTAGWMARVWANKSASMTAALIRHPGQVGEVVPTRLVTCRIMARTILGNAGDGPAILRDAVDGPVIELGAGNGRRSTKALLAQVLYRDVILTELDPILRAALIKRHWGDSRVIAILADAQDVSRLFTGEGLDELFKSPDNLIKGDPRRFVGRKPVGWYCFLPLLSLPEEVVSNVLRMIRSLGGKVAVIQYTTKREVELRELLGVQLTRRWVFWNLVPPANVYSADIS